jgi:aminoglycoside 3-N-acetyltransferase
VFSILDYKESLGKFSKRLAKRVLRPATCPWLTRNRLVNAIRMLGVGVGDTVLVHSSLSALGFVPGGATTVIAGLREAVGSCGTIVVPTHSWQWVDTGLREFDVYHTPSCVGVVSESFRTLGGVTRSLHPTHSVAALGPRAEELVADHEHCAEPCGIGSPYDKLLKQGAHIVLLGVGLESNTVFHTAEALAQVPYLLRPTDDVFRITDCRRKSFHISVRRHQMGVVRSFRTQEPLLLARKVLVHGHLPKVQVSRIDGAKFLDVMLAELAANPSLLLR